MKKRSAKDGAKRAATAKRPDKTGRPTRTRETPRPLPTPRPTPAKPRRKPGKTTPPAAATPATPGPAKIPETQPLPPLLIEPQKPRAASLDAKQQAVVELSAMLVTRRQDLAIATVKARANPSLPGDSVEAAIVESLADPTQRPLTILQRCELLGIARSTWYAHMEDPLFRARASAAWRQCCADRLGVVMEVLIESAAIIGRDGHRDRKLLLELLGEYQPGQRVEISGDAGKGRSVDDLSDEELLLLFEGREAELPPGVQRRLGMNPETPTKEDKDVRQKKSAK